ncbi:hypothetical protein AKJ09_07405 [Labilithrix luteola]|uniref:Uncharacterized protein n=1 Tax=Labilithrix luteola TaxID=1391654 RepID=A0A0K1Q515_9BACT|nr:hypothetical protein [Labilithrix luteola]AKV00742.1 hypothetical protein AKJ09_07405 [Labilithrix luteola]
MTAQPYREPAPPPSGPPRPSRRLATYCNLGIAAIVGASFGACSRYGCRYDHLEESAGAVLGFLSVGAIVVLAVMALRRLSQTARRRAPYEPRDKASVVGIVLTSLFALGSALLTSLFWFVSTQSPSSLGIGGWGRPLRIGKRAVTPDVRASKEWARGPRPDPSGLDDVTRAVLRDLWLHDARKEHASVPAFGRVARHLVALGAPSDLVRRAHLSCLQEIDHAERCFALASAYAGEDLGVQPMPALYGGDDALPRDRTKALVQVATEALVDGALLEDFNAELARTALDDVRDPACREALVRIVEDESEHAALAWDILAYCVAEGGEPVVCALRAKNASIGETPESLYDPALVARVEALPDRAPLYAHGRVRPEHVEGVFRARRLYAGERLGAILRTARRAASQGAALSASN